MDFPAGNFAGMQGSCNLKDQIQHKAAFIKEHMLLPGRPPAFIVGHSIGKHTHLVLRSPDRRSCNHPRVSWLPCGCCADVRHSAAMGFLGVVQVLTWRSMPPIR